MEGGGEEVSPRVRVAEVSFEGVGHGGFSARIARSDMSVSGDPWVALPDEPHGEQRMREGARSSRARNSRF